MTLSRWLPQPLLSLVLLATWLLLSNSVAPGHILLGALLALVIPWLSRRFWVEHTRLHRPLLLVRYILMVLYDIVVANLIVARIILTRPGDVRSRFVHFPLALQDSFAIAMLANTITLTPGTVSARVDPQAHSLLIHCLDVVNEQVQIEQIKQRYERPLKEIFES